jgi:type III restriction enzyme
VGDLVIANPIINGPYDEPARHFRFDADGITDQVDDGRRPSSYFVPVPRPRKGRTQLEIPELTADQIEVNQQVNAIRARVDIWRSRRNDGVTPTTRRLLEHWADGERDNRILLPPARGAETAIYLAEEASLRCRRVDGPGRLLHHPRGLSDLGDPPPCVVRRP